MRILSTVILSALMSNLAFARTTETLPQASFDALKPAQMKADKIYYTQKVMAFPEWAIAFPKERANLSLYPEYVEPTVTYKKSGVQKTRKEELMVFSTRSRVLLNAAPEKISVKNLLSLSAIQKFDELFKHNKIGQNQLMPNVVGKGQVNNFKWCNSDPNDPDIARPKREIDLKHALSKSRMWCSDPANSICVESCYIFGMDLYAAVGAVNSFTNEAEKKDYGIALQSELRVYKDEKELGLPDSLSSLTGVDTPVTSVIEQNMFYFNQIFEFGKVLVVLQEVPNEPQKTLVTALFVVGIKKRTYNMHDKVRKFLMGESGMNSEKGITAGLPKFIQATIDSIATSLEEKK